MSRAWMPIYWGDYLRDTLDLNTAQHGAYLLLIAHYWMHGGLPDDERLLAKICKANMYQWRYLREAIASKFQPGWKHKRIEEEILKAEKRIMQRTLAGEKSGKARRVAGNGRSLAKSTAVPTTVSTAVHQPQRKNITSSSLPSAAREEAEKNIPKNIPNNISGTTDAEAKRPPRKEEIPHEIGPAEYWARVASKS